MGVKKTKKEMKKGDSCFAIVAGISAAEHELQAAEREIRKQQKNEEFHT